MTRNTAQLLLELHELEHANATLMRAMPLYPQLIEAAQFMIEVFDGEHCGRPDCKACDALQAMVMILALIEKVHQT